MGIHVTKKSSCKEEDKPDLILTQIELNSVIQKN